MTYRAKIQKIIKTIEAIYDDAEGLRDIATDEEKDHWNNLRTTFYDAARPLIKLDRSLSDARANMKLGN